MTPLYLKKVLEEKGISQSKLGRAVGIAQNDINLIINGKKVCFPAWRKRISAFLGISEEALFPEYKKEA